jgi:ATP-dependent helicase/nuclease subunit B
MAIRPRVFTIPPSAPFLPTLIRALSSGKLVPGFPAVRDPLALAGATLYLPTRRACRLARDVFLDVLDGDAAILPRIVAIGDIDEDEIAFADAAAGDAAADALALAPALGAFERRLLLAQLVEKWASYVRSAGGIPLVANTPAAALALADDLARLMDDMATRQVPWHRLDKLVPDNLDAYWQQALKFLKIAREEWPKILRERGAIEAAERRDLLIKAEAARLARKSGGPVIAAGSTGSIPATAELIATIARLPHGAVVLPGLDRHLDEPSWRLIAGEPGRDGIAPAPGHPQFALQALLTRIGIAREEVEPLAGESGRERLLSEALRPSATTDMWRQCTETAEFRAHTDAALEKLCFIDAANAEEESLAIALVLREALEEPAKTAALVTPDRALARRVLAALARWAIAADDSGGDALAETPAGVFARLAGEAALGEVAPVTLLALLKHPLLRLDGTAERRAVATLERAVLRGPRPRPGTMGLAHALASLRTELDKLRRQEDSSLHRSDPRTDLSDAELAAAAGLVDRLAKAFAPLEALGRTPAPLIDIVARHRDVVAALSRQDGGEAAFAGTDGTALGNLFEDIATSPSAAGVTVAPSDYSEIFRTIIAGRVVRRPGLPGVRVRILGLLEARLTDSDRVVLGGLVEGSWPPETRTDAWLSRPMRRELGLDLPERRIGLSAHDFTQMLGAGEVFLSRALKVAGTPTVPSRFVQRLAAVAGDRWQGVVERGNSYLEWARALDRPEGPPRPAERPAPKPPRAARPAALSVTDVENWLRDPYTIYAKHVLRLAPLDAVDTPPGAADRGTIIHGAIGEFTQTFATALPADSAGELVRLGKTHFAPLADYPEASAFWWPRFLRIAHWFARWEAERRASLTILKAEIRGRIVIPLGERSFTLSTRADRIERLADGSYAILDYKTGAARTEKQVRTGLAPQLTLEAAILRQGGFADIAAGATIDHLAYVTLKGGEPAGECKTIEFKEGAPDSQADRALAKLTELARRFEDEAMPYLSLVHPMWTARYGDYDHLARVKEWSLTGGAADEAEGE